MRIAYFDEAGIASEAQEPFTVVAGVSVHGDTEWLPLETRMMQIIQGLVRRELKDSFYFHAALICLVVTNVTRIF